MDEQTIAILRDLLAVEALSQVTPTRLQTWQLAARQLLTPAPAPAAPEVVDAE